MKTLNLHSTYDRLSPLCALDRPFFCKLLKGPEGEPQGRSLNDLRIMPVSLGSELTCCGFDIEHHQLFRSALDNKYYLVFYPIKHWRNKKNPKVSYSYYILAKACHQDNYYCLMRYNVFDTYQLGDGCTLIRHT